MKRKIVKYKYPKLDEVVPVKKINSALLSVGIIVGLAAAYVAFWLCVVLFVGYMMYTVLSED